MNFMRQKLSDFNRKNKEDVRWAWNELGLKRYEKKIIALVILLANLFAYPLLIVSFVFVFLLLGIKGVSMLLHLIVSGG